MRTLRPLWAAALLALLPLLSPAGQEVLVTVVAPDAEAAEFGATLRRVVVERLVADGLQVSRDPAVQAPFLVDLTVRAGEQILIEASVSLAPLQRELLALTMSGPARLGIDRKALIVAEEIAAGIRKELNTLGPERFAALSAAAPGPAPGAGAPEGDERSTQTASVAPTLKLSTPSPAAAPLAPALEPGTSVQPSPIPSPEPAVYDELVAAWRRARRSRRQARIAWGIGAATLAGSGLLWIAAERAYDDYTAAALTDEAVDLRERTMAFRNAAIAGAAIAGSALAAGAILRLTAPNLSHLEQALAELGAAPPDQNP